MPRKTSRLPHDDKWLNDLQDIIAPPTHEIKVFADVKQRDIHLKIEYDNTKAIETITDVHSDTNKAKAFHESFFAFINELPSNIKLKVVATNCGYLFDEILNDDRANSRRARRLLADKKIKLINEKKTNKKDGKYYDKNKH